MGRQKYNLIQIIGKVKSVRLLRQPELLRKLRKKINSHETVLLETHPSVSQ